MSRTTRRLKLFRCWVRHVGRTVEYYLRWLRRWWRYGADGHRPLDSCSVAYSFDRLQVEFEAWLEAD